MSELIGFTDAIKMIKAKLGNNIPRETDLMAWKYLVDNPPLAEQGIHARGHSGGVLLNGRLLGGQLQADDIQLNQMAVDLADIEHDRQRQHDGYDWFHGIRAAQDMRVRLKLAVDEETLSLASAIVWWHVFPEEVVPAWLLRRPEWQVFKHADALDRTRNGEDHDLGDLNLRFIRLPQAKLMVDLARELSARRKQLEGDGNDGFQAAIMAGREKGLVQ